MSCVESFVSVSFPFSTLLILISFLIGLDWIGLDWIGLVYVTLFTVGKREGRGRWEGEDGKGREGEGKYRGV